MRVPILKHLPCPICPMLLKLLKWGYLLLHYLLLGSILIFAFIIFLAYRNDALEIAHKYLLSPLGISYESSSGSIARGFKLYNIHHSDFNISSLSSSYDLASIIMGEHRVQSIKIDGLYIDLDDFLDDSDSSFEWKFGKFYFDDITITNLQLASSYPIELDIFATNALFDGRSLDAKNIRANIKSEFVSGSASGSVSKNIIKASGDAQLHDELLKYSDSYINLPKKLSFSADGVIDKNINISTTIESMATPLDSDIAIRDVTLRSTYNYLDDFIDIAGSYTLARNDISIDISEDFRYSFAHIIDSHITGKIDSPYKLPNDDIDIKFSTNLESFLLSGVVADSDIGVDSEDLNYFRWSLQSRFKDADFLPLDSHLNIDAKGHYEIKNRSLGGDFHINTIYFDIDGVLKDSANRYRADGAIALNKDAKIWGDFREKLPPKIDFNLILSATENRFNLHSDRLALTTSLIDDKIIGSGNYAGVYFDIKGSDEQIHIDAYSPSLFNSAKEFVDIELHSSEYYDGEAKAMIYLDLSDTLDIAADINIPWYGVVFDSQNSYSGSDSRINLNYKDNTLIINNYDLDIANHRLSSQRTSYIDFSDKSIDIREFWIFDDLRAKGVIRDDGTIKIDIKSPKFSYKGAEGTLTTSPDIEFSRDLSGRYSLVGDVKILDGLITYLPTHEFRIKDDDIIIIQDVRAPSDLDFFINVHFESTKAIKYKSDAISLEVIPDVTIWKEYRGDIEILGMATITTGAADAANKHFDIERSFIYFDGSRPLNPYLDFTISHEVDYNKFKIYATHRLDSPIFLFSSDPAMSQNDIMSYILFGTPASDIGGGDGEMKADMSHLMMGAGIKGLVNSMTQIKIDKMNILTTTEGGLGFEVGARLSKDLRVLYKNDTVSSVLLQYAINRWLRLDIDARENSQGVNIIYIKDFRDFLPHNKR